MSDSEPPPAATEETAPNSVAPSRKFLARMLSYLGGSIVAAAVGYWLVERYVNAQFDSERDNRLLSYLNQLASDLIQVGIPILLTVTTVSAVWMLGAQTIGGVVRRYLGVETSVPRSELSSIDYADAMMLRYRFEDRLDTIHGLRSGKAGDSLASLRRKSSILRAEVASLKEKIAEGTMYGLFSRICTRLSFERSRLSGNSRINLSIGIVATLLALAVLGLPLVNATAVEGDQRIADVAFWRQYATRLPVGLLLQFVAFFFLKLYVACEMDIKSNKNEITNIESKYLAVLMSQENPSPDASIVINNLAETERNFILKKGEKTIGIENDSRFNDMKESLDKVLDAVSGRITGDPLPR